MRVETQEAILHLDVCFGTSCFIHGAQALYTGLLEYVNKRGISEQTEFKVSFCNEQCTRGPVLTVNGTVLDNCTLEMAAAEIERVLQTSILNHGIIQ